MRAEQVLEDEYSPSSIAELRDCLEEEIRSTEGAEGSARIVESVKTDGERYAVIHYEWESGSDIIDRAGGYVVARQTGIVEEVKPVEENIPFKTGGAGRRQSRKTEVLEEGSLAETRFYGDTVVDDPSELLEELNRYD